MNQVGLTRPAAQFSRQLSVQPQRNAFLAAPRPDTVKFGNNDEHGKPPSNPEQQRKNWMKIILLSGAAALGINFMMASQMAQQQQQQNPVMVPAEFSSTNPNAPREIPYTNHAVLSGVNEAVTLVKNGSVIAARRVEDHTRTIRPFYEMTLKNGVVVALMDNLNNEQQESLTKAFREHNIQPQRVGYESSFFGSLIGMILPILLLVLAFRFLMGGAMGGGRGGGLMGITKAKTQTINESVRFNEIRGYPEVVKELKKITNRYVQGNLGRGNGPIKTKPIKGFLLEGPPGTGKTMMAKAIATEANVPFHYMSGSDFVELFVGAGAARVRDLFAQAKKSADEKGGAIIFIDEIDSIGQKRSAMSGLSGGHDEREQTLNQLLQEISGFSSDNRIMIMAATNRAELLDDALLRSGRFDKKIKVDLPFEKEQRRDILDLYLSKHPTAKNLDVDAMSELTMGMSGADIANLINQMAEVAAERFNTAMETEEGKKQLADPEFSKLQTRDFNDALRNMHMGMKREQRGTDQERKTVAIHEVIGHGFVAKAAQLAVYLISMEPRGQALGHVMLDPRNSSKLLPRFQDWMKDLVVTMGGRASEIEMLGNENITPGAASDIQQARAIIRKMMATGMLPGTGAGDYMNPNFPLKDEDQKLMQQLLDGAEEAARKVIKQADPTLLWALVNKATDLKEEIQGADANKFYEDTINQVGADKLYGPIREFIEKFAKLNLPPEKPASTQPPTAA